MVADHRRAVAALGPVAAGHILVGRQRAAILVRPRQNVVLIADPSAERDPEKRKRIAWEIDRRLTFDAVRPMIFYMRGGTCWRPELKNLTVMVNSTFNGWRLEDVWLDR